MSQFTSDRSSVKVATQGFIGSQLDDDPQVVNSQIEIAGTDLQLTWGSRHLLNDPKLQLDDKTVVWLRPWGIKTTVGRFKLLACQTPRTVYGMRDPLEMGFDDSGRRLPPDRVNTGHYRPLLAWLGERNLRVSRLKQPSLRNKAERTIWRQQAREMLKRQSVLFATDDEGGITFIQKMKWDHETQKAVTAVTDQFGALVEAHGFKLAEAGKLDKRTKLLSSLHGFVATFGRDEFEVRVVEGDDDGSAEISREGVEEAAARMGLSKTQLKRLLKAKAFSGRLVIGDATVKGVFTVNPKLKGLVLVTTSHNIKKGLSRDNEFALMLEPTAPKPFVRLNVQFWTTHQWLFRHEPIQDCIFTEALEEFLAIRDGRVEIDLNDAVKAMTGRCESDVAESKMLASKWAAFEWLNLGLSLKNSWGLSEFVFRSHLQFLKDEAEGQISCKLPCSLYCQIFSESKARRAGLYEGPAIADDEIRICNWEAGSELLPCCVVSDQTFHRGQAEKRLASMASVHSGMDMDDYVNLFFRLIGGVKSVVVLRTPCGPGEYTILRHVPGDFAPVTVLHKKVEGKDAFTSRTLEFPEVSIKDLPPRSGQAEVKNQLGTAKARTTHRYGIEWLMESVDRNAASVGIGGLSNLLMMWALLDGGRGPEHQLAELSDVLDLLQEGGDQALSDRISRWVDAHWLVLNKTIEDAAENGRVLVDPYLWEKKSPRVVWDDTSKKLVNLFRFDQKRLVNSAWYKHMCFVKRVIAFFTDRREGKITKWLESHYETHGVFGLLASQQTEQDLADGQALLRTVTEKVRCIMQEHEGDSDDKELTKARQEAFAQHEAWLSTTLLANNERLLVPYAVAIYSGNGRHQDVSLFVNEAIRVAFLAKLQAAMPEWVKQQQELADLRRETEAVAAQFRPL